MIDLGLEAYISINELWYILLELQTDRFSGTIEIKSFEENNWIMYFYLGRILYVTGGKHPVRRWARHVRKCLADNYVKEAIMGVEEKEFKSCWEYEIISKWYVDGLLKREQIIEIIHGIIKEVFLDLHRVRISRPTIKKSPIDFPQQWIFNSVENYIVESKEEWRLWQEKGIADIDPQQRPVIRRTEELALKVPPEDYEKMIQLFKSEVTLRELALKIKKPIVELILSLLPYIRSGIMEMKEIPDWSPGIKKSKSNINISSEMRTSPAIAYIDSNSETLQNVNEQVERIGCNFIGIEDPVNAVAILLSKRPDLILIHLNTAITNGYQLCQMMKKISVFKDTPIVIISPEDRLVNKIQAKIAGATELVSQTDQLIKVFMKYLPVQMETKAVLQ